MGVNNLPKTASRQRRGCDLNPGPTAPESSTLTTRLATVIRSSLLVVVVQVWGWKPAMASSQTHLPVSCEPAGVLYVSAHTHAHTHTHTRYSCVGLRGFAGLVDKKLSYHRGTARCVVSMEILPIATQQCRNYLCDKS